MGRPHSLRRLLLGYGLSLVFIVLPTTVTAAVKVIDNTPDDYVPVFVDDGSSSYGSWYPSYEYYNYDRYYDDSYRRYYDRPYTPYGYNTYCDRSCDRYYRYLQYEYEDRYYRSYDDDDDYYDDDDDDDYDDDDDSDHRDRRHSNDDDDNDDFWD